MKHNYIKLMLPMLLCIASLNTLAHNFEVDGIYYNITSSEELTVAVTNRNGNNNSYSGQVSIPETVTYNEKTYRVTSIKEYAFYNCSSLTSVTIPNSVTSIGELAFYGCSGLTTPVFNDKLFACMPTSATGNYTVPNGIETIAQYAFCDCNKLSSVTITNSVKTVGYRSFGGTKLKTLIVGTGLLGFNSNMFVNGSRPIKTIWLTNTPPTNYTVAQGSVNYVANSQYGSLNNKKEYKFLSSMFDVDGVKYVPVSPSDRTCDAIDCIYDEAVTEVNINATVTYKGINMKVLNVQPYTFYKNVHLQKASYDIAGGIGKYVFYGCNNLKSALLNNNITSIEEYAFSGCSMLESFIVPDSVRTIGQYAFSECSSLPAITIPGSVAQISNYTFSGCKSLKEVIMADREDDGNLSLGSNGNSPIFADCPLDSVYIGRNIAYQKGSNYGYSPFYRNTSLRSVVITDKEEEISENEFYGCTSLQNVEIGDGVTEIGNRAFSGCASLQHFGFGTQVTSIGAEAFSDCTALTAIISKAETPPVCGSQALDDVNKWECTLTVPEGSVEAYQSADQWKEFFFVEAGDENGSTPIDPTGKKCATPVITFMDGRLTFTCETEGVEYAFEVTNADVKKGHASEVAIEGTYKVSVYATKAGYENSDVATMEFTLGAGGGSYDVNGDGKVDVADITTIINVIANENSNHEDVEEKSVTIIYGDLGINSVDSPIILPDGITLTFAQEDGKNKPVYHESTRIVRMYAHNSVTIDAGSKKIVKVVFYYDTYQGTAYCGNDELYGLAGTNKLTPDKDDKTVIFTSVNASTLKVVNDFETNSGGTQFRCTGLVVTFTEQLY